MKEILDNQYKNIFLWTPFVMAFGAAVYFSCGTEPAFAFPFIITLLLGAIVFINKNIFVRAIALFLFGFFYAMSFTHFKDTPQIKDSFDFIHLDGVVQDIDYTPDSTRILLNVNANHIDKTTDNKNLNLRISIKDASEQINIGDTIRGKAKIFHPSARYVPDSFDFARWAYFNNISGTGFFEDFEIIKSEKAQSIRTSIHNRANSVLTDALVLGYKKVMQKDESNIWKSVGIGHVWSISGFHMTLVGGWLFALFYLIFRLIPYLTRRIPAKYPALICSWVGLLFYLGLSGISVATVRAFLMATLVYVAILVGRSALSLRNASLAFLIIFLFNPYAIMTPGFQLSFAAIFGLLWFFEDKEYVKRNLIRKIGHFVWLSFLSALIATIFTLPFIVAHFGYVPIYGLIGNIIILPIFSFLIMPMIMIGTLLAMFGNYYVIGLTNHVYDFALNIAQHITDLPYANLHMPHVSNFVLMLYILGFLFLMFTVQTDSRNKIIKHLNYIICAVFMFCATIFYITMPKPLFYATSDHELVAFNVDGKLQFNKARASKHFFAFSSWYDFNNEEPAPKNKRYKCDHGLCIYKSENWNIAYMQNFTAIYNNIETICQDKSIDYIVTTFDIKSDTCHAKVLQDGIIIYPNGKITKIINRRPWHNLP